MFCIDKAITFSNDSSLLQIFTNVVETGKLRVDDQEIDLTLTPDHKYSIIKLVYGSKDFTLEQKQALRAKVFENDTSDKAH